MTGAHRDTPLELPDDDPLAVRVTTALRQGDLSAVSQLLGDHPGLAHTWITSANGAQARSLLHILTDWPGHVRNGSAMIHLLVDAGADVNARFRGSHQETPLHWAASSDDVAALDALLDAGADLEASGAVIAGGTALDDAVAFGQWGAARRLVERGARTSLGHAAALGLIERVQGHFGGQPLADPYPWGRAMDGTLADERHVALWCAGHGGAADCAEYLLRVGANPRWAAPWDATTALDAARRAGHDQLAARLDAWPRDIPDGTWP